MAESNSEVHRICDALRVKARLIPDRAGHDDSKHILTFEEWDRQADEVAGGLAAAGLAEGDRVFLAISMDHPLEMAVAVIATMRAGGIVCPVNTRLASTELHEYSELLESRFAMTDVPEKLETLTFERIWDVSDMPRDLSSLPDQAKFDFQGDAVIVGTSGTTGRPKGVVLNHTSLMATAGDGTRFSERTNPALHSMPFTGYGGFIGQCIRPIMDGQTSLVLYPYDVDRLFDLIETKRPVSLMLVPTMLRLLLDHPRVEMVDMSSIRVIITGTSPLPHDSVTRTLSLWPEIRLRNAYAMSEGGFSIAATTPEQLAKPGCVGQFLPNMEIRDAEGRPAPQGTVGEIYGKAEGTPRRYWRDEGASQLAWIGAWTRSGDLGYVDEDGDLILTGRSKELIIRGGYNIAPIEIEDVLHRHPAVKDAAVVGVAHEVLGEDVAAAVCLASGVNVSQEELESFCREHLADNKIPRTIVIMGALPLNQNAKVVKRQLLPILQAEADRQRAERHR